MDDQQPSSSDLLLQDDSQVQQEIYQPLTPVQEKKANHQNVSHANRNLNNPENMDDELVIYDIHQQLRRDNLLSDILNRDRVRQIHNEQFFSFNVQFPEVFHDTPQFKEHIQSPFKKFYKKFAPAIRKLLKNTYSGERDIIQQIEPSALPSKYSHNPVVFFIGIGNFFRKRNFLYEALYFYKLAAYVDPYFHRTWNKLIDVFVSLGFYKQAMYMAKTSFLFKPHLSSGQQYLQLGDKAEQAMHSLRGILPALKNMQNYDKILFCCVQLQMKKRKVGRGLALLEQFSQICNFRANFSHGTILIAREYENYFNKVQEAYRYIQIAIFHGCTKLQGFLIYLEYVRHYYFVNPNDVQFLKNSITWVLRFISNLTKETLYKFYMEIALLINASQLRDRQLETKRYIKMAYDSAIANCRPGQGRDRAVRSIYFTVLSFRAISPGQQKIQNYANDDHLRFMDNRKRYIEGLDMVQYNFNDWKYYLHYTLAGKYQHMMNASKQWPLIGRLIAEWIHVLRIKTKPIVMLKLWRTKIDEVPKSGELWCEGGRIYMDLQEYENAAKCFKIALHFTPQYGDSFFQQLRILIKFNKTYEIHQLFKSFIINQPFIGNVLSFIRQGQGEKKLTLRQIWDIAVFSIKQECYRGEQSERRKLTAFREYNKAIINPHSHRIRQKLFASYEQLENKYQKN